jgi:serine palmitoyltransferase
MSSFQFNSLDRRTGKEFDCLNLGSYNYLGFSNTDGPILDEAVEVMRKYGISTTSSAADLGM